MDVVEAERLREARVQLHWASQVLSATCDAVLEHERDDSQSSLLVEGGESGTWLETRGLASGVRLGLRVDEPRLAIRRVSEEASVALGGLTIDDLFDWVLEHVADLRGMDIELRDYDMPSHSVGEGGAFDVSDSGAFGEVGSRLWSAWGVLEGVVREHGCATRLLLWPHHFDVGSILLLREGDDPGRDPCVGIGYSLGDDSIDGPYYYANPYAIDRPGELPALRAGAWAEGWFGAVLREGDVRSAGMVGEMIGGVLAMVREGAGV